MHWQFSRVLKNPIYTRKFTEFTDFTDFTTLQTYRFLVDRSRTISAPGPTRARTRATTRSVAARRERCINSFPRAHARGGRGGGVEVNRGAAARACGVVGAGRVWCVSSSGVSPVGWRAAGLRSCWEAGPRARAHAESRIDFGTKSAYFWRQSGCTARIRKAWRWRGSAGSSTYSDAGLAVVQEHRVASV